MVKKFKRQGREKPVNLDRLFSEIESKIQESHPSLKIIRNEHTGSLLILEFSISNIQNERQKRAFIGGVNESALRHHSTLEHSATDNGLVCTLRHKNYIHSLFPQQMTGT